MHESKAAFYNFRTRPKGENDLCEAYVHQLAPLPVCQQPRISVGAFRKIF